MSQWQTSPTEKFSVFTVVYESSSYTTDQNKTQQNVLSNNFCFQVDSRAMEFLFGWLLVFGFGLFGCFLLRGYFLIFFLFFWLLVQRKEEMFYGLSLLRLSMCDQYFTMNQRTERLKLSLRYLFQLDMGKALQSYFESNESLFLMTFLVSLSKPGWRDS